MPGHAAGKTPAFIEPMLATAIRQLPADANEYVADVKWDGMRAVTAVSGGRIRFRAGPAATCTGAYPELGALAAAAGRRTLVLDGEIVVLAAPCRTSLRSSGACSPGSRRPGCSPRCPSR